MASNYAPYLHNIDWPDHGRTLRVTATDVPGETSIGPGRYRIDQVVIDRPAATTYPAIPPLPNGVNYVFIDNLGAVNSNIGGPYPADSIPLARVTVALGEITDITDDRCFQHENTGGGVGGNTLDQAYDQGGAGAGRQINATDGPVLITNPEVDAGIPNLELTRAPADIAAQIILALRAIGDPNFRFEMLGNGVMRWGAGAGAVDVVLERTGADRLGFAIGDVLEVDTIGSRGGTQVGLEDGVSLPEFLGLPPTLIGIVGGVAAPTRSHHSLSAEAGIADDLDTLGVGAPVVDGDVCIIRPDTGDTITVKHNLGNLLCVGNADIVLNDDHDFSICIYNATLAKWMCLSDTTGGGGGGGHVIEEEGVPLAAQPNLNVRGPFQQARDAAPNTELLGGAALFDAIVDAAQMAAWGGATTIPIYSTLAAALAAGRVSILYRNGADAAPIASVANNLFIVGDGAGSVLAQNLTLSGNDCIVQDIQLNGVTLDLSGLRSTALACTLNGAGAQLVLGSYCSSVLCNFISISGAVTAVTAGNYGRVVGCFFSSCTCNYAINSTGAFNVLLGNIIYAYNGAFAAIQTANYTVISGNVVDIATGKKALWITFPGCSVTGNVFKCTATPNPLVDSWGGYCTIAGNFFYAGQGVILFAAAEGHVISNNIFYNTVTGAGTGIQIGIGCAGAVVSSNNFISVRNVLTAVSMVAGPPAATAVINGNAFISFGTGMLGGSIISAAGYSSATTIRSNYGDTTCTGPLDLQGWHGSKYRIRLFPSDLASNSGTNNADRMAGPGYSQPTATMSVYWNVPIPTGFRATAVMVYGSAARVVNAYACNINTNLAGAVGAGVCNAEFAIAAVASNPDPTPTNYLSVEIVLTVIGDQIYGGYVVIAPI